MAQQHPGWPPVPPPQPPPQPPPSSGRLVASIIAGGLLGFLAGGFAPFVPAFLAQVFFNTDIYGSGAAGLLGLAILITMPLGGLLGALWGMRQAPAAAGADRPRPVPEPGHTPRQGELTVRRTVPALVLALGLVVAGCSRAEPGTDQLAAELAKVTAERDQARAALAQAREDAADLEVKLAESAVKDPGNCQLEVEVTGENLAEARDWLAGKRPTDPAGKNARETIDNAISTNELAADYCGDPAP